MQLSFTCLKSFIISGSLSGGPCSPAKHFEGALKQAESNVQINNNQCNPGSDQCIPAAWERGSCTTYFTTNEAAVLQFYSYISSHL